MMMIDEMSVSLVEETGAPGRNHRPTAKPDRACLASLWLVSSQPLVRLRVKQPSL